MANNRYWWYYQHPDLTATMNLEIHHETHYQNKIIGESEIREDTSGSGISPHLSGFDNSNMTTYCCGCTCRSRTLCNTTLQMKQHFYTNTCYLTVVIHTRRQLVNWEKQNLLMPLHIHIIPFFYNTTTNIIFIKISHTCPSYIYEYNTDAFWMTCVKSSDVSCLNCIFIITGKFVDILYCNT